jgi:hypothetical protein
MTNPSAPFIQRDEVTWHLASMLTLVPTENPPRLMNSEFDECFRTVETPEGWEFHVSSVMSGRR